MCVSEKNIDLHLKVCLSRDVNLVLNCVLEKKNIDLYLKECVFQKKKI